MIRDEEISRLIKYAQGMGLSVKFKPYVKGSTTYGEWAIDGSEITIYVTAKDSKLYKILSLIHELGHHKAFVNSDRQIDPQIEENLVEEDLKKKDRKRILEMEIKDSSHWEDIYRDTNCKFGIEKLRKQKELDIWSYEFYYETGKFPTKLETKLKRKELRKKYGC